MLSCLSCGLSSEFRSDVEWRFILQYQLFLSSYKHSFIIQFFFFTLVRVQYVLTLPKVILWPDLTLSLLVLAVCFSDFPSDYFALLTKH